MDEKNLQDQNVNEQADNNKEIDRRKVMKDVVLGGTAAPTAASLASCGSEQVAASVLGTKKHAQATDIGELKSIKIKCLSETGWFDTDLLLADINGAGGMEANQYDIPWDQRNPGGYCALIEAEELDGTVHKFMLDTGWNVPYMHWVFERDGVGKMLKRDEIEFMVLSHEHMDHFWGLPALSKYNSNLKVFVPSTMSSRGWDLIKDCHKEKEVEQLTPGGINTHFPGFATVMFDIPIILGVQGETVLYFNVKDKGIVIATGCGHPTPGAMIEYANNNIVTNSGLNFGLYGGLHIALLEGWSQAAQEMLDDIIRGNFGSLGFPVALYSRKIS
jgi:7,8-dihydropterin-6-yl-methyl-4-(beta-D-ribofuranosyl)aminobenzene 5'-phosphate synthase